MNGTAPSVVRGVGVAVDTLLKAFLIYSEDLTISLFAPGEPKEYDSYLRALGSPSRADHAATIQPLTALLQPTTLQSISAWLEPTGSYDLPYEIRDRLSTRAYPIVCPVHALSLHSLVWAGFARVLFADTFPFDSFVCTSRACRSALLNIFAELTETLEERYRIDRRFAGRCDIIPLSVDTDTYSPGDKPQAKGRVRLPPDSLLLLYVGRLSLLKADLLPILTILADMPGILKRYNVIVGLAGTADHGFIEHLRSYLRAVGFPLIRLRLYENLSDEKKVDLLRAADIFISPADSPQESFGIAPIEAMATGVPQIVSDWDGYRDTVSHGVTGFRIPTRWMKRQDGYPSSAFLLGWQHDHGILGQSTCIALNEWREAFLALIENEELRRTYSQASRLRAVQHYSLLVMYRSYHALLSDLSLRSPVVKPTKRTLGQLDYHRCFSHFATETVEPSDRVVAGPWSPSLSTTILENIFPATRTTLGTTAFITHALAAADRGPQLISSLLADYSTATNSDPLPQLMWALKYGLLSVEHNNDRLTARN